MEENFADLKVTAGQRVVLIEVKSDPRPRSAIRQALGQLLEYASRCAEDGELVTDRVVAGPGELQEGDARFLQHLVDP
jgi:hypothetical protein